jgi:predicted metal-dependent hydrolase
MAAFDTQALVALRQGLEHFRVGDYFAAHDDWEEVWRDLNGPRRLFWQAMIHLVVGAYHFTNGNLRGCQGQWYKALQKCDDLIPRYAEPAPASLTGLRDMVCEGLAMLEDGSNPLPHLAVFATSVVSEDWFTLI